MLNSLRSRISAPLVISLIALFAALGGVAAALPGKNTVNSGDVKKNSLKGVDIKESTLDLPSTAVPKSAFGVSVNGDASINTSTLPGTTAVDDGSGYTVTFPINVSKCVPVASDDNPPIAALRAHVATANQVFVLPADSANTPFNLIVNC